MDRHRKPDSSFEGDQVHGSCEAESPGGFSVIESIVMLVVLAIFTLIVMALLIRESETANDEVQGNSCNTWVGNAHLRCS